MVKYLVSIVFFLSLTILPQEIIEKLNNKYTLRYVNVPQVTLIEKIGNLTKYDFIESMDESKPGFPKIPSKTFFLAIPPEARINIIIENEHRTFFNDVLIEKNPLTILENDSTIKYIETDFDKSLLSIEKYPEKEIERVDYFWIGNFYVAAIKINPYQYSFNQRTLAILDSCIIKITINEKNVSYPRLSSQLSFYDEMLKDVIINFDKALEYRSINPSFILNDSTGNWIDYSKEYIKLKIPYDNIYRINYNDLLSYGVNPDIINPKTLKLFVKGIQRPIYVEGEDDNIFNQNDFIEFYSEKNYTYQNYRNIVPLGQDYFQYINRYNDSLTVWLTWDGEFGQRLKQISATPIAVNDTIKSHLVKIHQEKDVRLWYYDPVTPRVQLPFWQENKTFTWLTIGSSGSQSFTFQGNQFVPSSPVNVIVRLISYSSNTISNAHRHGLSLNSTSVQDTIVYNYKQTVNFSRTYNSSQLVIGNNVIRVFGLPSSASFHQSLIDWVDIDYYRFNHLVNDTLKIIIPDSIQTDIRVVRIDNVTNPNNILIYKIKPEFKKFNNFNITGSNPYQIFITDTVSGGDQYYITTLAKTSAPVFVKKKLFENLRNTSRGADYILLSNKLLENSVNQYKNFIQSNYNKRVELVFDEDIFDEFSYGLVEAEAIKRFLVYTSVNWVAPRPSFLTIIGDANYDYKNVVTPAPEPRKKNILTSFGNPVSDVWYVTWDSSNVNIPQMFVGRIPANNDNQVMIYLQKHQKYIQKKYDYFNKSFIFFSGGDPTKPNELSQIIAANNFIMNNYVKTSPLFGNATHFYKTINPPSNFGPYTLEQVQKVIDEGGLFISYIGHSGTRTWDNSISEVEHIKNKYNDRLPLISDYGCSTGKFAEPDVDAFGELFICQSPNGQAIAYYGNSSFGFLSTSLNFPKLFYQILIQDSLKGIGYAHNLAKIQQFNQLGVNDVTRVFNYCNLLFGDPIIGFRLPEKPNFTITESDIKLFTAEPNDLLDSVKFSVSIKNLGIVNADTLDFMIEDFSQDSTIFSKNFRIPFTKFIDTILISSPVGSFVGNRKLKINLDPVNLIDEIYEDDNVTEFNYIINSTSLTPVEISELFNTKKIDIKILNPFIKKNDSSERLKLELSTDENFTQTVDYYENFDTLLTKINLANLIDNQRYYYRVKIDDVNSFYNQTNSFIQKKPEYSVFIDNGLLDSNKFVYHRTFFDSTSNSWKIAKQHTTLKIQSAGANDGSFGSIQLNGYEQLSNTYYWGLATAIIDSITLRPTFIRYFNVPDPGVSDSLTNYVNNLPQGTLIAMTISADAAQNILGYVGGTPPRNAIKNIGSLYIDSIRYRESWAILGRKGASIGSVPEDYRKLFAGVATVEISKNVTYDTGYVVFPDMKFAKNWKYLKFETNKPLNSSINYIPVGIRANGQVDTLFNLSTQSDSIDISNIDAKVYPSLKVIAQFIANQNKESPEIFSLGASYDVVSELAMNYQTVSTDKDTIMQGQAIQFKARVFNVGKSDADSFKVKLDLIRNDNSSFTLIDTLITRLKPDSSVILTYNYVNTIYDGYGNFNFRVIVDSSNVINEFLESNNIFLKPFYVKRDTSTSVSSSSVWVKFNGQEIFDWDYVEPNSKVNIEIQYPVWFSVEDTSAIQIYLNGFRKYAYQLNYDYDTIERKINIYFDASLPSGEHNLRVFLKDIYGRISNQPLVERYFKVSQEVELLEVYNYPNPFKDNTYFTFILTQLPEEAYIKIFTIAGRLIKEIKLSPSQLNTNFNKIYWDGKDEDGDMISNGVYIYKFIVKKDSKVKTTTQKLAILR
ncbi:MAG: C25 family cysteine peptidase [Candidatus Woesearchaeota archaeon]